MSAQTPATLALLAYGAAFILLAGHLFRRRRHCLTDRPPRPVRDRARSPPGERPAALPAAPTEEIAGRYLALAGVVGPPLFVLVFTLAGFLRQDYSALRDAISDLGVGQNSWIQNANFFAFGVLLVLFALAFFGALRDIIGPRAATIGALLITLTGIGVFSSGIFTAAPETEALHFLLGFLLAFGSAIASITFIGWRLRRIGGWQKLARYSLLTAAGRRADRVLVRRPQP